MRKRRGSVHEPSMLACTFKIITDSYMDIIMEYDGLLIDFSFETKPLWWIPAPLFGEVSHGLRRGHPQATAAGFQHLHSVEAHGTSRLLPGARWSFQKELGVTV